MDEDSSKRDFWDSRYAAEKMPWDAHGVPARLREFLASAPPRSALIPGCGSAYEVAAFHDAGWTVTAIDFSPVAVERARRILGPLGDTVILGDFFLHPLPESAFDLIYERTFLCALPPRLWLRYAERMKQLARPGGKLAGFFLYGDEPEPPPYPLTETRAAELLGGDFARTKDEPVADSLPLYAGKERWQEWTRQPH